MTTQPDGGLPHEDVTAAAVIAAVRRGMSRLCYTTEAQLQPGIQELLTEAGLPFRREASLSRHDRPDFIAGSVAVETKVKGSPAEVRRQLARYAASDQVTELVLITRRAAHRSLVGQLYGKPVHVILLSGGL